MNFLHKITHALRLDLLSTYWKGILLAFASSAAVSATFIASKVAMQELTPLAFTPLWFGAASIWGMIFYLFKYGLTIFPISKSCIRPILLLGTFNGIGTILVFMAINWGDPALAAFFSRSDTVYTVLLGAWVLREKLHPYQWLGVAVSIVGTGVMTYKGGTIVWLVLGLSLVSSFLISLSTLIAKKNILAIPPLTMSIARSTVITLITSAVALLAGQVAWPSLVTWGWIIGGSFLGPFLSYFMLYQSMLYLDLSRASTIRATYPLFVAIYSLVLFGTTLNFQQLMGGLIMLGGVILMLWDNELTPAAP